MASSGTLKHSFVKTELSTTWEIDDAKDKLLAEGGFQTIYSPPFGDGKWQLSLSEKSSGAAVGDIVVSLLAIRAPEDLEMASSTRAWQRAKTWTAKISVPNLPTSRSSTAGSGVHVVTKQHIYDSERPSHKLKAFAKKDRLIGLCREDTLTINCTMWNSGSDRRPPHRAFNPLGELIFDNPDYADLVFIFPRSEFRTERRIFASKAILSQSCTYYNDLFSDYLVYPTLEKLISIDPSDARPRVEEGALVDDEDRMDAFDEEAVTQDAGPVSTSRRRPEPNQDRPASATADTEEHEGDTSTLANDRSVPMKVEAQGESADGVTVDGSQAGDSEGSGPRRSKRRKVQSIGNAEPSSNSASLRRMTMIETRQPFVAFRAFIAYLHTGSLPMTPLPSDYLVAYHEAKDQSGGPPENFTFTPRGEWLRTKFYELKGQRLDWKGVEPCSPHALFRIAVDSGCDEAREIAQSRIVRSLTIENVAYEITSPLCSREFADLEDALYPFFRENFNAIKKTRGWSVVLDKQFKGQLGADDFFHRMFSELEFGKLG